MGNFVPAVHHKREVNCGINSSTLWLVDTGAGLLLVAASVFLTLYTGFVHVSLRASQAAAVSWAWMFFFNFVGAIQVLLQRLLFMSHAFIVHTRNSACSRALISTVSFLPLLQFPLIFPAMILSRCSSVDMLSHILPLQFPMSRLTLEYKLGWSSLFFCPLWCFRPPGLFVPLPHTPSLVITVFFSFSSLLAKPWDCIVSINSFTAAVRLCFSPKCLLHLNIAFL